MAQFDSLDAAIRSLPDGAAWSSCFGFPVEGGCAVLFRAGERRWSVENGPHDAFAPFTWTVREITA